LLFFCQLHQPVGGAPQLEGSSGLQAFAFQPDAAPANLRFDQRRSLHRVAYAPGSRENVITSDLWTTFQVLGLLILSANRFA
jgi:uncharacterized protein (DUF2267 family)